MSRLRRSLLRFRKHPASAKHAAAAIISVTLTSVFVGAVIVRVFDGKEYPTFGRALWFTLQTVTTVGYGDVTPTTPVGRAVAAVVMLSAIGLITVVTAAITSVFIEAARAETAQARSAQDASESRMLLRLETSLEDIVARLDRLESALSADPPADPPETDGI